MLQTIASPVADHATLFAGTGLSDGAGRPVANRKNRYETFVTAPHGGARIVNEQVRIDKIQSSGESIAESENWKDQFAVNPTRLQQLEGDLEFTVV